MKINVIHYTNKEGKKSYDHLIDGEKASDEGIHTFIVLKNAQQTRKKISSTNEDHLSKTYT